MIDYLNKFRIDNKTAFVIGGLGLIGKEISRAYAMGGAKVVILDIKKKEGKILEYNGESVLFQRQEDLQLYRFKLTALALQSQRMIKDNYMTANYNVPKLPRPLTEAHIKKLANYADNLVLEKLHFLKENFFSSLSCLQL